MVYRLIDFALVVLKLLIFKVCGIIRTRKSRVFRFFPVMNELNKIKNNKKHSRPPKLVSQSLFK